MGFTLQLILANYLIPLSMIFSAILIIPAPRFIKKLVFYVIELRISRISEYRIGGFYIIFCAAIWVANIIGYLRYDDEQLNSVKEEYQGEDFSGLKNFNIQANLHHKQFRDLLIFGLGTLIASMNFVLTSKLKEVYRLEEKRDSLKKK